MPESCLRKLLSIFTKPKRKEHIWKTEEIDWAVNQLFLSIYRLSLPYEEQIKPFPIWVVIADELAEDLDFHLMRGKQNQAVFGLSDDLITACSEVDKLLAEMTDRHEPELWTLEALQSSKDWKSVRQQAKKAYKVIQKSPNFSFEKMLDFGGQIVYVFVKNTNT